MRARGFTLFEVIVAVGILVMLSGGVFGFLWNVLDRRHVLVDAASRAQAGGALLDRIEADVACALAGDAGSGAGVSGTATGLRLLTRGVAIPLLASEKQGALNDLQGAEYQFDAAAGQVRARRWSAGGAEGAGEFEIACRQVQRMRVRYFDGRLWKSSFDSLETGSLPVAVEVALWYGEPGGAAMDAAGASPEDGDHAAAMVSGSSELEGGAPVVSREPDRVRVIIVPDGPVTSWRESR